MTDVPGDVETIPGARPRFGVVIRGVLASDGTFRWGGEFSQCTLTKTNDKPTRNSARSFSRCCCFITHRMA
jgi:hypothetical protein